MSGSSADLFKLDVDTGEWNLIDPLGTLRPSARYLHAMAVVGGTDIYLFGGYTDSGEGWDWWMGQTEGCVQAGRKCIRVEGGDWVERGRASRAGARLDGNHVGHASRVGRMGMGCSGREFLRRGAGHTVLLAR
jgi:hypothetical protein